MSRSTGTTTTGRVTRLSVRSLAVVLLLLGMVGSSTLAGERDRTQAQTDPSVAAALTHPAEDFAVEQEALRRVVEANERTDRSRREAVEQAGTLAEQQASRADGPDVRPAPEPEPEPEPEQPASSGGGSPSEPVGPVPDSCNEYSGNRATGCALLLDAGLSLDQMSCLDNLWTKESGWNERARNPSSGAYGIPQSLPGDKMSSHGSDWQTNPATQISWGLDYIKGRYGTPCSAWSHSQANGWY